MELLEIRQPLMDWYKANCRTLPWRGDHDPYHIWVSEIMLQQTRVEAVKRYYERFLNTLPEIKDLAEAPEDVILKLWEGLGYYSRVRNMQKAARVIMSEHGGSMPADFELIHKLPGIGDYTAGAIASNAYDIAKPAVDGNVLRVITRVTKNYGDITKAAVKKEIERQVAEIVPAEHPGDFNQALMELGAIVCVPNDAPHCDECPLKYICRCANTDEWKGLPVKPSAKSRKIEDRTVLVIVSDTDVVLHKRGKDGLLAGLYEFPNLDGKLDEKQALKAVETMSLAPLRIKSIENAKHIFSHIEWHMNGYLIRVEEPENWALKDYLLTGKEQLEREYSIPSAFKAYLKYYKEMF